MAFDLIIWGYQSNYESISANDIQPGHCAFFDFENEKDEETKSIQILKLKGKKFQLERQTLKLARKVNFFGNSIQTLYYKASINRDFLSFRILGTFGRSLQNMSPVQIYIF